MSFVRPPHPLDLTEAGIAALQSQLAIPSSLDSPPWLRVYPQSEIRALCLLLTGQTGPLNGVDLSSLAYSAQEALVSVYLARAWGLARNPTQKGILAGKPAYEAWEMLCARSRAARSESASWPGWWLRLLTILRVKAESVPQVYAQIWEASYPALRRFPAAKNDPAFWNRIVTAAGIVAREPGWRWQYLSALAAQDASVALTLQEEIVFDG